MLKELFGKFYTQTTWEAGSFIVLHREQIVPVLLSIIPLGMHHVQVCTRLKFSLHNFQLNFVEKISKLQKYKY